MQHRSSHVRGRLAWSAPILVGALLVSACGGSSAGKPSTGAATSTASVTRAGSGGKSTAALLAGTEGYGDFVRQNVAELVSGSRTLCAKIDGGSLAAAKRAYPAARVHYERIEPVAATWEALDTEIDGRWENPVTVPSRFVGFHRIEQLLWEKHTLAGAGRLCAGLVGDERQLLAHVRAATYKPLEMASGATDLINEASTTKVAGEEERYSHTDLVVLEANVEGAQEIVNLLRPYLQSKDPALLTSIDERHAAAVKEMGGLRASPGYEDTGYVDYSTVPEGARRRLSSSLNAYAESLSQLSAKVS
jgi:iron uptake system component EfeO